MSGEEKKEESTPEVEEEDKEAVDETVEMEKEEEAPAKVDDPTPE